MKILILSLYYSPDLSAGSFRTTALVKELRKLDENIEIDVLTSLPSRYTTFTAECSEEESDKNIFIKRINLPSHCGDMKSQVKAYFTYVREVLRFTKNKDYAIVYATTSRLFTGVLGAYVSSRVKSRFYLDIRDIFVDTINDVIKSKLKILLMPILKIVESYTIRRADKINLVSKGFSDYFNSRYKNLRLNYVSNGIDETFLNLNLLNQSNNSKSIRILYAGNIGEGQGLEKIIPKLALKLAYQNVEIKVIGDGGARQALESSLIIQQVSNVEILPPVKREVLVQEYMEADVLFLHLNSYKAFEKVLPSKLFEYAATGKPILAGVAGYAKSFINEEISNAQVFEPCNLNDGLTAFNNLVLEISDRKDFIEKFSRKKLMNILANDIISVIH